LNQIPEIIEFDKKHSVPSVFFFGMDKMHGLSYTKSNAASWIKFVLDKGFDAGVHGIEFENLEKMKIEFNDFKAISKLSSFGIRMHYVRYNDKTFQKMAELNYVFDTSEFNKERIELKPPYKIGKMWEFPLFIMDTYALKDNLAIAKNRTTCALNEAKERGIEYFTILFHDYFFNDKTYPEHKAYYDWFVSYCSEQQLQFTSYRTAIDELESDSKLQNG
jgi:hypothetical protein